MTSKSPTLTKKRQQYGDNLIDTFLEQFHRKVKKQPHYGQLILHIIIGQLPAIKKMRIHFGDNELDLRISGCLFKPSGSGGGRGMDFFFKVVESLNINAQIVTEIKPESLVGSSVMVKDYDPIRKGMYPVVKITKGALDPTPEKDTPNIDILIMNEADMLFDSRFKDKIKDVMLYYQIALNPMGTRDNKIGVTLPNGKWLEFNPECSLLFISYPPDNFYNTIVKRGFLQRMIVLFNTFTLYDRAAVSKELTGMLESMQTDPKDYNRLIERIVYVNEYWSGKEDTTIAINKESMKLLKNTVDEVFHKLSAINETPRKSLEEFTQRWIEHIWVIAWHHMILRLDDTLIAEDVQYAKGYMMPIWTELIGLFEADFAPDVHWKKKRQLAEAIEMYENICTRDGANIGDKIDCFEFLDRLRKQWQMNSIATKGAVRLMEERGWFATSKRGHNRFISLVERPDWYDDFKTEGD